MNAELDSDFFLVAGIEWAGIAAAVRAADPDGAGPLRALTLGLWRKASYSHLLFTAGKYAALHARLRVLAAALFPPGKSCRCSREERREPDEAGVLAVAADPFERVREAVSARYPNAFADSGCAVSSVC